MCTSDKSRIAHDVLAYLVEHQDAQDTLEGIVEWWLIEQKIQRQKGMVEQVLGELIRKEFLEERTGLDGQTRYVINHRKAKEIEQFLRTSSA
jgi:hypothetical protein